MLQKINPSYETYANSVVYDTSTPKRGESYQQEGFSYGLLVLQASTYWYTGKVDK